MDEMSNNNRREHAFKRWLPLILLVGVVLSAYGLSLHNYISLNLLAAHRDYLTSYVAEHLALSILVYIAIYVLVAALSLPGAGLLSIVGGFIFGWIISVPVSVVAATLGATLVFQIVKTSLGATMAERAGPFVQRLSAGFAEDAFNYLLFLRLIPAFPFFVVNSVAGICRVSLKTFVLATFIGIIPGSIAYAWLGRGLGSMIDAQVLAQSTCAAQKGAANCPFEISVSSLVTPQLLLAFAALGILSLIPIAFKKWKAIL